MTTIAEKFLEDFESSEEEEDEGHDNIKKEEKRQYDDDDATDDEGVVDIDFDDVEMGDTVESVSTLISDEKLVKHLANIKERRKKSSEDFEEEEEHQTIVDSNAMVVEIDNDILAIHKWIRDIYATRFPELEQTVVHPIEYAKVVKRIGNNTDFQSLQLEDIVSEHTKLTMTISASATTGKPLPEHDLQRLNHACDVMLQLNNCKTLIYEYIQSRMEYFSPNLSALVGSDVAAQLIGIAGGLPQLTKIPSCNIQTLGSSKKTLSGYSVFSQNPHFGLLLQCEIVANCPNDLQQRALRQVAGKVALVARVDAHQSNKNDGVGIKYREEIEAKIAKWQEPPPPKPPKPLPVPESKPKKKRGGKRYRKMKEKYKVTEIQRMRNRMPFNAPEDEDSRGIGYGMLGQTGVGGRLRAVPKETQKLAKLNKLAILKQKKRSRNKGTVSGLASSLAFTPVQGIELINPELKKQRVQEANNKYFSNTSSFTHVTKRTHDDE